MQWILLLVLAALASIIYAPVNNFLVARSTSNATLANVFGSNFGKMALTALSFFAVIVVSAMALSLVGKKPSLPSA